MKKLCAILLAILLMVSPCALAENKKPEEKTPQSYQKDEFPRWAHELRRAEIITIGVFPFSLFITKNVYRSFRFIKYQFDQSTASFQYESPLEKNERLGIFISSVTISVAIAVFDYILGKLEQK